ncbi:MAG: (Fe-S)-binding protein, partial [Planctomycetota bacterium]|jgi:Fe-S oxidoreductase
VPWPVRAFGGVRAASRWGSALAPLSNWLGQGGPGRWVAGALLGIDARRSLPRFEPSLYRWLRRRGPARVPPEAPAVVLLPDCFTVYSEPKVGRAAVTTLEQLGYRPIVPPLGCCGRAHISTGQLATAQGLCGRTAAALARVVDEADAVAIVGCEPSCVSAITDDWPDLQLPVATDLVTRLASMSMMIEAFVERRWDDHPVRPHGDHDGDGPEVLLHGHCHQKALWGVGDTSSLVRRWLGSRLEILDSGCCGMAGAFGYTAGHYDLSMEIAELALFPALRDHPDAVVLAPGTSCRHQIRDGLGREARHPIELVAEMGTGAFSGVPPSADLRRVAGKGSRPL